MLKKHIHKILIVLLCFTLLPLSLFNVSVAKASGETTVYVGAKHIYYTNDQIANASSNQIQISVTTTGSNDTVVVYDEGKQKDVDTAISSISNTKGYITIIFGKEGNYTVKTIVKDKVDDGSEYTFEKLFIATKNFDLCSGPSYTTDLTKLQNYQDAAVRASFEDGDTTKPLFQGDKYEVPSAKDIIDAGSLGYDMFTRRLYLATPGSLTYVAQSSVSITNTTTKLSFDISSAGKYRYYITFESDAIDGDKSFNLNADGLVEMTADNPNATFDGFYRAYKNDEELVATKFNNEYTYVLKSNEDVTVTASEITRYELIIPTFTFEIEGGQPPRASYKAKAQENGYVGLSYTISSFDVSGYKTQEKYVLKYSSNYDSANPNDATWTVVEDGFDAVTMSFVPDKVGYYKVTIEVEDGYDNDTVTADSLVISVLNEPIYPNFKTSFGDWISVNTMPFVCLCISFVCLVGIVLLIFVKPKKKVDKVKEEDR
ncbi:MAG: hypothetical protein IJW26_04535 [Clostridia bacterium]|nr:hypothetical protein [Clostridia bacterium]